MEVYKASAAIRWQSLQITVIVEQDGIMLYGSLCY